MRDAPLIVAEGTPLVPFMSEAKRELVRQRRFDEARKLPNFMLDEQGRLYVEVLEN